MRSSTKISWKTRGKKRGNSDCRLQADGDWWRLFISMTVQHGSWMPAWAFSLAIVPFARQGSIQNGHLLIPSKPGNVNPMQAVHQRKIEHERKWVTVITTSTLQKLCSRKGSILDIQNVKSPHPLTILNKKMLEKHLQPQLDWSFSTTSHGICVPRLARQRLQTSRRVDPHGRKAASEPQDLKKVTKSDVLMIPFSCANGK